MAETQQITFTHREVAEALVKQQDIHEGLWGIYIEFGLGAGNAPVLPDGGISPVAIIPVLKIGLQRFEEANSLTVDAAEVNPIRKTPARTKSKKSSELEQS